MRPPELQTQRENPNFMSLKKNQLGEENVEINTRLSKILILYNFLTLPYTTFRLGCHRA